jgi:hypothetical protein
MQFITKKIHSYLDYPVAISLMVLPFVLGLGETNPIAFYLSLIVGIAALGLTILTDHQTGLLPVISYRLHLLVDSAVAVLFVVAPFIFSFEGLDAYFYWINGAAVILVVSLHKNEAQKPVALV